MQDIISAATFIQKDKTGKPYPVYRAQIHCANKYAKDYMDRKKAIDAGN